MKTTWQRPAISRATSSPVSRGIWMSRKATSGAGLPPHAVLQTPSLARATTCNAGHSAARCSTSSSANSGSSSAISPVGGRVALKRSSRLKGQLQFDLRDRAEALYLQPSAFAVQAV